MNITKIKPYSDETLTYNETTSQYELTMEYVKDNFEVTFKNDEVLKKRIKKNSRNIYRFIINRGHTANSEVIKFLLNKTEEGRRFLIEVLSTQMEADLASGYNDMGDTPAVNLNNGQVIDRAELIRNQVSVNTEELINNSASYFGISIIYQAPYPYGLFLIAQ